jgi:hypothetical protein
VSGGGPGRLAAIPALGRLAADVVRGLPVRRLARRAPRGALRAGTGAARSVGAATRRAARRAPVAGLALYAIALGLGLGLWSAEWATRGDYPFGGVAVPPWTAWPRVGGRADPYARAINARRGDVPLAVGEGVALTASQDEAGRPLDPACSYRVSGATPPARLWTLTVYAGADPVTTPLGRSGFTSAELIRDASGAASIVLDRAARPGNWLPLPEGSGPVGLVLRLYDTPVGAGSGAIDPGTVPRIERLDCAA